jgi:hypothetical protein
MKEIECNPDVSNFTKSFKSIGYNHYSAILDLIDNSVSANSSSIWIEYSKNNRGGFQIKVIDNGSGMDRLKLIDGMRIASSDPTSIRNNKDLGKFGLGMKLASFSQTDRFTVISKAEFDDTYSFTWDLDYIRKEGKWLLLENSNPKFYKPKAHGTEVILEDVFEGIEVLEDQVIAKLRSHIAVVYNLMKGVKFFINDKEIELIDPFFSNSLASNHSSVENIRIEEINLKVQSHQIPHENKLKPKEKRILNELNEIGMGPGLYIYRKNRLIAWSGWEGLGKNLRINDLYRISVLCNDDADWLFNIEVKKSQISITDSRLRTLLKSSIINFSDIARKPYQKRAHLSLKDISDLWMLQREVGEKVILTINKDSEAIKLLNNGELKLNELLSLLESTVPYESILYYLNLKMLDNESINFKKIESAKLMFKIGLLTELELKKITEKYES